MELKMNPEAAKRNNVTWYNGYVTREDRERQHGHKGAVVWFTGLSASGKSTIAHLVEKELYLKGCSTYVLDGDNVRHGLCSDLTFCREDRKENLRRIGEMTKLFVDAGIIVLTAFISPYRQDRGKIRALFAESRFLEIHVDCSSEVCATRDQKGIYDKAKAGIIKNFTGVSAPYEVPKKPELVIQSEKETAPEAAKRVLDLLEQHQIVRSTLEDPVENDGLC
jgi:adenylylsulfate kinase